MGTTASSEVKGLEIPLLCQLVRLFWPLIGLKLLFSLICTFHIAQVFILLPLNHAQPFKQIATKWKDRKLH